jgi:hypothetical protein
MCGINGGNLNKVIYEASRHFRNKKRKYLRDKINVLATDSKIRTAKICI